MVTEKPLDCRSIPREADMMPFPSDDVTPPVTKMYLDEVDIDERSKNSVAKVEKWARLQTCHLKLFEF